LGAARYKSEPLRSWEKAKELRMQYYRDYVEAKEKGGLGGSQEHTTFNLFPAAWATMFIHLPASLTGPA